MKYHVLDIAAQKQKTVPSGIGKTQFSVKEYLRFIRADFDPEELGC